VQIQNKYSELSTSLWQINQIAATYEFAATPFLFYKGFGGTWTVLNLVSVKRTNMKKKVVY